MRTTGSWRTLWHIKKPTDSRSLQPEQEAKQKKKWLEKRNEGRRHKDEVSDVFDASAQTITDPGKKTLQLQHRADRFHGCGKV